jgi:hypothetical protein
MYCKCGKEIHPKRVEFLEKYSKPLSCIECAEGKVQKVVGFQVVGGKTEREVQIVSQETGAMLNKLSARAGMGVSKGCKMDQSFKPNLFK